MTEAHRLPASPAAVDSNAAPNATPKPTRASRNFSQTSAEADCSHAMGGCDDGWMELVLRDPTICRLAPAGRTINQPAPAGKAFVTSENRRGATGSQPLNIPSVPSWRGTDHSLAAEWHLREWAGRRRKCRPRQRGAREHRAGQIVDRQF